MFPELAHTILDFFKTSKEFALNCYTETKAFPSEERLALSSKLEELVYVYILTLQKILPGNQ